MESPSSHEEASERSSIDHPAFHPAIPSSIGSHDGGGCDFIQCNADQPGAEPGLGMECCQTSESLEECLLRNIFCIRSFFISVSAIT